MPISFKLDVSGPRKVFRRLGEVARKPFDAARGRRQVAALRRVIRREAAQGGGFTNSGGVARWKTVRPFGSRPGTTPPLGGPSSTYWQSWLGGAGSVVSYRRDGVSVGSSLPWAIVHRGGVSMPSSRTTVIRAKKVSRDGRFAMGHKLRGLYGVHIRQSTLRRGLQVPSRPNVNPEAPQYRDAVSRQFDLELQEAVK